MSGNSTLARGTPEGRLRQTAALIAPFAALFGLILLFFNKMAFSNLILARGDAFLYFYPYWQGAAEALRSGRVPLWNPDLFMGVPFLANSQVGFFYPLNWPLWLLLPAPYAVSASIILHLFIAGCGAFFAGRQLLDLEKSAALFASLLFALGGYLTAQVEHVNQLQGLAWLPWTLVALAACGRPGPRAFVIGKGVLSLSLLIGLQLLAGHTQTSFITLVALVIWSLAQLSAPFWKPEGSHAFRLMFARQRFRACAPLAFAGGVILALMLVAAQLLPTLELAGLSGRQGGLPANEALSFSLHPLLLARSLLPGYGQSLFTEYLAFLPVTALLFAVLGAWQWRRWPGALPALVLTLAGLLLALGLFNPLNWLLVRLPGFSLFRAPARWLVFYSLGVSLLAGLGWQVALDRWLVVTRKWADVPERSRQTLWHLEKPLRLALALVLGLFLWSALANILAFFVTVGPEAPYEPPNTLTLFLWLAELLLAFAWLSGQRLRVRFDGRVRLAAERARPGSPWLLALVSLGLLFAASRGHPYNRLTTPEAYFDLRPSVARLQANETCVPSPAQCSGPPGRLLTLSDILFDPGDLPEIETIYGDQLAADALYDYVVAVKHKEIIAPNLSMAYGLPSVDGFDGGILPLRAYSQVTGLILPDGATTTDGRLRENLAAVPQARWLDLFNAQYLVTDKVGDVWFQGVYFDLQHSVTLAGAETVSVGHVPRFESTELWLVAGGEPGPVFVSAGEGQTWQLAAEPLAENFYRYAFPQPATPEAITLSACLHSSNELCRIEGLTLVDGRDNTFQSLVLGDYRLIHSGDVKIYDNLDVLPRAFLVRQWQSQPDVAAAIAAMRAPEFDPRKTAVVVDAPGNPPMALSPGKETNVTFQRYEPERVILRTASEAAGLLVMTDTFYPGWSATIDGEGAPIHQVDGLFRGVKLPAGEHEIIFSFQPASYRIGRTISFVAMVVWLILALGYVVLRKRRLRRMRSS